MRGLTVHRFGDISARHLTVRSWRWAMDSDRDSPLRVFPYKHGFLVGVPGSHEDISDLDDQVCPQDVRHFLRMAREQGCDLLRFDADAPTIDGAPIYT